MDKNEKKRIRDRIGQHLDVSGTRMSDEEASFLDNLIENYDSYRGTSQTRRRSHKSFSSDGKYTRTEESTYTFTDDVGIRHDYKYYDDDDGQTGESSSVIKDARGVLDWFRNHR